IAKAKAEIELRSKNRYKEEQSTYNKKIEARKKKEEATGKHWCPVKIK
ncbi:MAG: hypothetical protein GY730_03880, partial [bacterium]|nr:hypothetical protein [bacterium]